MKGGLLLQVVVGHRAVALQLPAREDQTLLARGDALFPANIGRNNTPARKGRKNATTTTKTQEHHDTNAEARQIGDMIPRRKDGGISYTHVGYKIKQGSKRDNAGDLFSSG